MNFRFLLAGSFITLSTFALPLSTPNAVFAGQKTSKQETPNRARLSQSDKQLQELEDLMADYVNAARKKQGLAPLTLDPVLSEVARAHSAEMRDKKYFAHESPTKDLRDPLDRYLIGTGGSTPRLIAENIFRSWGSRRRDIDESEAKKAHDSLMNSTGHRANLLRNGPTRIGIGFVANNSGDLWVTQMFVKP